VEGSGKETSSRVMRTMVPYVRWRAARSWALRPAPGKEEWASSCGPLAWAGEFEEGTEVDAVDILEEGVL
jgi:hypothetical protein